MNVTQIFCHADDFCQGFIPDWEQRQLEPDENDVVAEKRVKVRLLKHDLRSRKISTKH